MAMRAVMLNGQHSGALRTKVRKKMSSGTSSIPSPMIDSFTQDSPLLLLIGFNKGRPCIVTFDTALLRISMKRTMRKLTDSVLGPHMLRTRQQKILNVREKHEKPQIPLCCDCLNLIPPKHVIHELYFLFSSHIPGLCNTKQVFPKIMFEYSQNLFERETRARYQCCYH